MHARMKKEAESPDLGFVHEHAPHTSSATTRKVIPSWMSTWNMYRSWVYDTRLQHAGLRGISEQLRGRMCLIMILVLGI